MKINAKEVLKGLGGEELKMGDTVVTVGETISNILLTDTKGGKMKLYSLAQKFYNDKNIELDDADFSLVKTSVETSPAYNALVIGQLLVILDNCSNTKE